jgi:hypothetical protein
MGFMAHAGKDGGQPPILPVSIHLIVNRDQPHAVVLAQFANQQGMDSADNSPEILADHQIALAAANQPPGSF